MWPAELTYYTLLTSRSAYSLMLNQLIAAPLLVRSQSDLTATGRVFDTPRVLRTQVSQGNLFNVIEHGLSKFFIKVLKLIEADLLDPFLDCHEFVLVV